MNNKEVINRLLRDMEKIELPPIPEKVLQAVREQKQKYLEYTSQIAKSDTQKRNAAKKWVFAAMVTALLVSVPIIVVVSNNKAGNNMLSDNSSVSDQNMSANSQESISAESGTLEHIKIINLYGTVSLSSRSEVELETMLESYSKENSVYEDDKYLYNFNSDGKLIEILKTDLDEDIQGKPVSRQEISEEAEAILKEYFPDFADGNYITDIQERKDSYPAWNAYFIMDSNDYTTQKVRISFDKVGIVQRAILTGTAKELSKISKEEAIQIALTELRSGKYNILDFNIEDVDILTETNTSTSTHHIIIDKIPYTNNHFKAAIVIVDSIQGKILSVDI